MRPLPPSVDLLHTRLLESGNSARHWFAEWWQLINLGAMMLVLLMSPSSYNTASRRQLALRIYTSAAPLLLGFSVLCALLTMVLTRIVLTSAQNYGLSQYALQVVIRVLVLEIVPLFVAVFVALRCTIPDGAELTLLQAGGALEAMRRKGIDPIRREVLPRVLAGLLSGITLAALSSIVALVTAYLTAYGLTLSGIPGYVRLSGQLFSPAVSTIFAVKTVLFCLAVSLIPMASALYGLRGATVRSSAEMRGLVRMFAVILLIEMASLVGNYY